MTNEALAAEIQAGRRERLPELWEQTERFIHQQARRHVKVLHGVGGVTEEDLYHAGYPALLRAAETYRPCGRSFLSWLSLHLKTAFAETAGYRRREPLNHAVSLEVPFHTTGTWWTPQAAVEDRVFQEQSRAMLEAALRRFVDSGAAEAEEQAETLRRRYFHGQTRAEIAKAFGVEAGRIVRWERAALRALAGDREVRDWKRK